MQKTLILSLLLLLLLQPFLRAQDEDFPDSDRLIVKVQVLPAKVVLKPGQKIRFKYICTDAQGNQIPAFLGWSFSGGTLQRDGTYTAGPRPGRYKLVARVVSTGVSGEAVIIIKGPSGSGQLARLQIQPATVTLKPGASCRFQFKALDRYGHPVPVPISLSYTGGKAQADGTYTAGSHPGEYYVEISAGKYSARANVIIIGTDAPTAPVRLTIIPAWVSVRPAERIHFQVRAYDTHGRVVPVDTQWKYAGGQMERNGIYTAGKVPGKYLVEVRAGALKAQAQVIIRGPLSTTLPPKPGKPVALKIEPAQVTLRCGQCQTFRFYGLDANGRKVSLPLRLQFTGGRLDPTKGVYTAGKQPGHYYIKASTAQGLKAIAHIDITDASGKVPSPRPIQPVRRKAVKLTIIPARVVLPPGGKCRFQCRATDAQGHVVPVGLTWSFHGGRFSLNGWYQAGTVCGEYRLRARTPDGLTAQATIIIQKTKQVLWKLRMTPASVVLHPGEKCTFKCTMTDLQGAPVSNPRLSWTFGGGDFDLQTGVYTAGSKPGQYLIRARFSEDVWAQAWIVIKPNPK